MSYSIDPISANCYPETTVLINKLDIRDEETLRYDENKELNTMTAKQLNRRLVAVKTADAINSIEGAPISAYARSLSTSWAKGEITGEQMRAALLASHKKLAAQVSSDG